MANPNRKFDKKNPKLKEIPFEESTLENIDGALLRYIDEELNLFATTNKGWKKTPVMWVTGERAYELKRERSLRDSQGTFILPVITLVRTGLVKDPAWKGTAWGNVPRVNDAKGGSLTIARRIQQDKTSNFANANAKKKRGQITYPKKNDRVVYETISIPMPVYVAVNYEVTIRTEYQQQMNELTTPFLTENENINYLLLKRNGHRYEAFVDSDFSSNNNLAKVGEEERKYETTIKIKVLGYLIGSGPNEERPKTVIRENPVEIKIPREHVILGDIPPIKNSFYRERFEEDE